MVSIRSFFELAVVIVVGFFICFCYKISWCSSGETLGPALAENTGLTELNLSWNHLRGLGAIAIASGLEVRNTCAISPACPLGSFP